MSALLDYILSKAQGPIPPELLNPQPVDPAPPAPTAASLFGLSAPAPTDAAPAPAGMTDPSPPPAAAPTPSLVAPNAIPPDAPGPPVDETKTFADPRHNGRQKFQIAMGTLFDVGSILSGGSSDRQGETRKSIDTANRAAYDAAVEERQREGYQQAVDRDPNISAPDKVGLRYLSPADRAKVTLKSVEPINVPAGGTVLNPIGAIPQLTAPSVHVAGQNVYNANGAGGGQFSLPPPTVEQTAKAALDNANADLAKASIAYEVAKPGIEKTKAAAAMLAAQADWSRAASESLHLKQEASSPDQIVGSLLQIGKTRPLTAQEQGVLAMATKYRQANSIYGQIHDESVDTSTTKPPPPPPPSTGGGFHLPAFHLPFAPAAPAPARAAPVAPPAPAVPPPHPLAPLPSLAPLPPPVSLGSQAPIAPSFAPPSDVTPLGSALAAARPPFSLSATAPAAASASPTIHPADAALLKPSVATNLNDGSRWTLGPSGPVYIGRWK